MANFSDAATCAVCRRRNQLVFTQGPLESFCERCAWEYDTARLELERREEHVYAQLRAEMERAESLLRREA